MVQSNFPGLYGVSSARRATACHHSIIALLQNLRIAPASCRRRSAAPAHGRANSALEPADHADSCARRPIPDCRVAQHWELRNDRSAARGLEAQFLGGNGGVLRPERSPIDSLAEAGTTSTPLTQEPIES